MSDWLVEIMSTRELLKFASTKSGGVFVTITTTGVFAMDKWYVDSLGIRDWVR